ncbi:MAG: nucleotidyl transferase AbiEii/AbiGii toxin family protein [Candidatus Micrarchaeota archaeon]|nr:nucleotidyl transferase AbiEii/AbiGii toxin family protein [Candidatus Micrarchaeota archaeon]MDE1833920.1 nucleotidyl transferase AbiEii/AbiGii toxin family protein [Candidatus Micrarchaeota archaeon]MDE1859804.1 nucleotidyl transferase AbiEii/AbiGii toxin family protein [Candidatus Micrarchaeota archaeon]
MAIMNLKSSGIVASISDTRVRDEADALKRLARGELGHDESVSGKYIQRRALSLIYEDPYLRKVLVLKGGAALDIVYDSRRSSDEDLDFSLKRGADIERVKANFDRIAYELTSEYPGIQRVKKNDHHSVIKLNENRQVSIQVELSKPTLLKPMMVDIDFPGIGIVRINAMAINEQLAEKIDAIVNRQNPGRLLNDIYDIDFMLTRMGATFHQNLVIQKLNSPKLPIESPEQARRLVDDQLLRIFSDQDLKSLWDEHTRTFLDTESFDVMAERILERWARDTVRK